MVNGRINFVKWYIRVHRGHERGGGVSGWLVEFSASCSSSGRLWWRHILPTTRTSPPGPSASSPCSRGSRIKDTQSPLSNQHTWFYIIQMAPHSTTLHFDSNLYQVEGSVHRSSFFFGVSWVTLDHWRGRSQSSFLSVTSHPLLAAFLRGRGEGGGGHFPLLAQRRKWACLPHFLHISNVFSHSTTVALALGSLYMRVLMKRKKNSISFSFFSTSWNKWSGRVTQALKEFSESVWRERYVANKSLLVLACVSCIICAWRN